MPNSATNLSIIYKSSNCTVKLAFANAGSAKCLIESLWSTLQV